MTNEMKSKYRAPYELRTILMEALEGKKFQLDCGHHITFGHNLGNNIIIYNGNSFKIICTQCGY